MEDYLYNSEDQVHCGNCFHMKAKVPISFGGKILYNEAKADCKLFELPSVKKNGPYNIGKNGNIIFLTWLAYAKDCTEFASMV